MQTINGKEIKGFSHADGVHWYWGDKEVAVINESRKEIEWCDRTFKFPEDVINAIRKKIPETNGKWTIEARRVKSSATQGNIKIFINDKDMDMCFEDKMELDENGKWISTIPDEMLGKYVYACFWHKLDYLYHYSDKFKKLFNPDWKKEDEPVNFFEIIKSLLPDYESSYDDFWTDSSEIMVRTEEEANVLADFIESLYRVDHREVDILTGCFDNREDIRNGEVDQYTGWWYVTI